MGAFMTFNGRRVPGDALSTRGSRVRKDASPGMRLPHVASNSAKTRVKRVPGDAPFASSIERLAGFDSQVENLLISAHIAQGKARSSFESISLQDSNRKPYYSSSSSCGRPGGRGRGHPGVQC
ncbi:hypothetical protein F3Y22_tig00112981pilonHSYRG00045 [Hibiscus syriacus]|uniref:Uncharacterized protein n=1 Tax=Hibiscus syriacus TaxID=106335 RepID=A0A6A2WR41_HIBSY|nr:hypothetical protein F3Y22_tig00112981pilonHSYRG00045 [Hibiscus syriacus]